MKVFSSVAFFGFSLCLYVVYLVGSTPMLTSGIGWLMDGSHIAGSSALDDCELSSKFDELTCPQRAGANGVCSSVYKVYVDQSSTDRLRYPKVPELYCSGNSHNDCNAVSGYKRGSLGDCNEVPHNGQSPDPIPDFLW